MGFKCGIVGLPNVGKSTLFNALTKSGIEAANYPFCTIEPHVGLVPLPDERLQQIADVVKPNNVIPTTVEFVDIAGLVAGASKGEGLGNQFLANIRETQAIAHVVRCFESPEVAHVSPRIDPIADIETIETELALADLATVEKALEKLNKKAKSGDKDAKQHIPLLEKVQNALNEGHNVRMMSLTAEERAELRHYQLLTAKPVLYIANVDEAHWHDNPYVQQVEARAREEGAMTIALSASMESAIVDMEAADQQAFLNELGLKEPGLNRLIRAGFELLGLQTFFTAGPKEVRAWTVPKGATAYEAAGVIHTDFQRGFIRAEVIGFEDFIQYSGEQGAKEAGKLRLEGRDYKIQDGDVVYFRFNV